MSANPTRSPRGFVPQRHALVVEIGDCEFHATCYCGKPLATTRPDQSFDVLAQAWERHVMTEVPLVERPGSEF